MQVAVVKETYPGERRVALVPSSVPALIKAGHSVTIESGAGQAAGFRDAAYTDKGATIAMSRDEVLSANIILAVRAAGADVDGGRAMLQRLKSGQVVIATCDPLGAPQVSMEWSGQGVTLFSLELIPRITRAQSMDVLSSQATIAGYRAVLVAAMELPRMFPMMMTAAGTMAAARVLILGVGVAGLQAIATARKLGGIVSAYDLRPATREQVESLGAKFVDLQLDSSSSEDRGGYAKAMDEEFYRKQREELGKVIAQNDVVITTAAIPGKRSPLLVTAAAVGVMAPGSVIIDLAAERGGNCELTVADQRTEVNGVTILGPTNIAADVPYHASQMFSNNVVKFLLNMTKDSLLKIDTSDEIVRETLVAHESQMVQSRVRELLGLGSIN